MENVAMLPAHLKRYIVDQDYSRYTPVDQEVWRYILRRLKSFLSVHAHPCYCEGLEKSGIEVDRIPDINVMSEKLEKFGWRAVPVSGFIPPAAFMELQALGYLPIASDMRTIDHLDYTPAPDIVHEAAGHAPILLDDEFSAYLRSYAQVARKAIISREDMDLYEAIRILSDVKEDPNSTPEQIREAEERLERVSNSISHISEASYLSRMNWWTAEYGLIGTLDNPRIFGAGLLSSVGESRTCLDPKVKKIPLTVDCINYSYDITEPQPQLFVTPSFQHLGDVLEDLAKMMAFRVGGAESLEKAKLAKTVNTVQLNSGLQISGKLKDYLVDGTDIAYLQFEGPTQLCYEDRELPGHGTAYHSQGFGSPVGFLVDADKCLSQFTDADLKKRGIEVGKNVELKFKTGALVKGTVIGMTRAPDSKLLLISFKDCTVTRGGQTLFEPSWGTFDMAVGSSVPSVYGGPADRPAYGETEYFVAKIIPRKQWPPLMQHKHSLYQEVRDIRDAIREGRMKRDEVTSSRLEKVLEKLESDFPNDWLLRLNIYELSLEVPSDSWRERVSIELENIAQSDADAREQIEEGLKLLAH